MNWPLTNFAINLNFLVFDFYMQNGISGIYSGTFANLPSLEKLYLDDNLIKE